jgi:diguanylate cyclase (GGDEF)-like protein
MRRANYLAQHDPLTGLFNRAVLTQQLEKALEEGRDVALLLIDLDDFKTINDSRGHDEGDKILQFVARKLARAAATTDLVARLGGDEFAILLVDAPPERVIIRLCDDIIAAMSEDDADAPARCGTIGTSIGISRSGSEARTAPEILKNADLALYQAKTEGQNLRRFYDPILHEQVRLRNAFESDLRLALARDEFYLLYQPQVSLTTRRVEGAEALLRWHRAGHGLVSPLTFIASAEKLGCIKEIGAWVLGQACRDAASWPEPVDVAVNVSPLQFRDPQFLDIVRGAIADTGLDPRRLVLEVTESLLLTDTDHALATIADLHAIGVRVALDDFGTGFSSLSYLTRFKFDSIKIDRSFVQRAADDPGIMAILRAIFQLAHSLELGVTAEGIELETQAWLIASLGCTKGQGYLFGRPEAERNFVSRLDVTPAMTARM